MKVIVALVVAVAFACANADIADELKIQEQHIQTCVKETGLKPETVKKLHAGDTSDNDKNTPCFLRCISEQTGAIDKNGVPQREVILKQFAFQDPAAKREDLEVLADKCINLKGADQCDTSLKIYQCYWSNRVKA